MRISIALLGFLPLSNVLFLRLSDFHLFQKYRHALSMRVAPGTFPLTSVLVHLLLIFAVTAALLSMLLMITSRIFLFFFFFFLLQIVKTDFLVVLFCQKLKYFIWSQDFKINILYKILDSMNIVNKS